MCTKLQDLTAKPDTLDVAGIVGTGLMDSDITMCCAETDMQVFLLVIRTNCSLCLSVRRSCVLVGVTRGCELYGDVGVPFCGRTH